MTLFSPFLVLGTPFLILAIQLKLYFASIALTLATYLPKIVRSTTLLGTADFLVHHIYYMLLPFTQHYWFYSRGGTLYSKSSRLIPDKPLPGFRFPLWWPTQPEEVLAKCPLGIIHSLGATGVTWSFFFLARVTSFT